MSLRTLVISGWLYGMDTLERWPAGRYRPVSLAIEELVVVILLVKNSHSRKSTAPDAAVVQGNDPWHSF